MRIEGTSRDNFLKLFRQSLFFVVLNVLAGVSASLFNVLNSNILSNLAFAQLNVALSLTLVFGAVTAAFSVATTADISRVVNNGAHLAKERLSTRRRQSFFLAVVLAIGSIVIANFKVFSLNYLNLLDVVAIGLVVFSSHIFSTEASILQAHKLWKLAGVVGFLMSFPRIPFVLVLPETLHLPFVILAGICALNIALTIFSFTKSNSVTLKQEERDSVKKSSGEQDQKLTGIVTTPPMNEGSFRRTMLAIFVFNSLLSVDILVMTALFDEQELIDYVMAVSIAKISVGLIMTICSFILPYISNKKKNYQKPQFIIISVASGVLTMCFTLWVAIVYGYSAFGHAIHPIQFRDVGLLLPELTTLYIILSMLYALEIYMIARRKSLVFLFVTGSFILTVVLTIGAGLSMKQFIDLQLIAFSITALASLRYALSKGI